MSDETKVWMALTALAAVVLLGAMGLVYQAQEHTAQLRLAACADPQAIACALAQRK